MVKLRRSTLVELERLQSGRVMALQMDGTTLKRLVQRGFVRLDWRDRGLREAVLCAVLTPAGEAALRTGVG